MSQSPPLRLPWLGTALLGLTLQFLSPHPVYAKTPSEKEATEVRGFLDKEQIRTVIHSHIEEVKACYERELATAPELAGRVLVQFTIGRNGQVQAGLVESSTLGNSRAEQCILAAVKTWVFPAPQKGIVIITYPFVLRFADSTSVAATTSTPPSAPPQPLPEVVPALMITQSKVSTGDDPHLPEAVKVLHPCDDLVGTYRVCIEPSGTVGSVEVLQSIAGADTELAATLRTWRFKPQPKPVCFWQTFVFHVGGDTTCVRDSDYHPRTKEEVSRLPVYDVSACGAAMSSRAGGRTGTVALRLQLDERGKLRQVRVLESQSQALDSFAVGLLRTEPACQIQPALDKDGTPVPFVIDRYQVTFK